MTVESELPNLDTVLDRALQAGGETDLFDFKELLDFRRSGEHKIKLLKAVGSFHNTDKGGHIIIGVTNDRHVVGIAPELAATYDQSPIQNLVGEYFAPPPPIQVRHHQRSGKNLVLIQVRAFSDFPSIVRKSEVQGKERLQAGTFLVRSGAAESALLTTDVELRKLCDAILARRTAAITGAITLTSVRGEAGRHRAAVIASLWVVKTEAERLGNHAEELNKRVQYGSPRDYCGLLLGVHVLERELPQVAEQIAANPQLRSSLALLRSAAAAADDVHSRLLETPGDWSRLIPFLSKVYFSAPVVSREVGQLLKQ